MAQTKDDRTDREKVNELYEMLGDPVMPSSDVYGPPPERGDADDFIVWSQGPYMMRVNDADGLRAERPYVISTIMLVIRQIDEESVAVMRISSASEQPPSMAFQPAAAPRIDGDMMFFSPGDVPEATSGTLRPGIVIRPIKMSDASAFGITEGADDIESVSREIVGITIDNEG